VTSRAIALLEGPVLDGPLRERSDGRVAGKAKRLLLLSQQHLEVGRMRAVAAQARQQLEGRVKLRLIELFGHGVAGATQVAIVRLQQRLV